MAKLSIAFLLASWAIHGGARGLPKWTSPVDGTVYIRVPPGEQIAGASRYIFPDGFWIAQTEVTVRQFRQFTRATGFRTTAERAHALRTWKTPGFPQSAEDPVVWLSFEDALAYAKWSGAGLPTEAEWVYAAHAGATTRFPWGDTHDHRYMWHRGNSGGRTRPVASKLPNSWGIYDMVGNAWEYTEVSTPEGLVCPGPSATLGASWTRCPHYRMRSGAPVDAIEHSLGPIRTACPSPGSTGGLTSWDDDRGLRCVRRIPPR